MRRSWRSWVPAGLVGLGAFVATRIAMQPGLGFWDTAELQTVAPLLGTAHPTGFPTYVVLGWVANLALSPFGEPALRMNLFAGLSVAVAAAVTVDLVRTLTRSVPIGVMAGIGLAVTTIVWEIGTHAEAHALHLAFVAILLRSLVAWEEHRRDGVLVVSAVVFGLAAGNHSLMLLLGVPIGLYVLAVDRSILQRPRFIAGCAIALVLTVVLIYLELPLRAGPFRAPLVYGRPETWDGFWYVALAEQFRGSLVGPFDALPAKFVALVARMVAAFGPLAALLPLAFLITAIRRPHYALLSGTAFAITVFFAASYINALIERYYLGPVLIGWTWLGVLAGSVATLVGSSFGGEWRPHPVVATVLAAVLLVPSALDVPVRLHAVDRSRDVAARRWVEGALAAIEPNAIVLSWWSYSTPLWYAQHVEGRRPDIDIIDDRTRLDRDLGDIFDVIDANLASRPVYVIRMEPLEIARLRAGYVVDPVEGLEPSMLMRIVAQRVTAG